ncbi:hypothetical protein RvY_00452 [Ramazzottius varieornatus]|uniref:Uncharacterized protein n=1 Tax=Ramazzottius varieornatus TaxID=947166 RepID=A0A1D1UGX6_RAMVA|nr:hypothetical protein RvY_00452 [Ramazzottius varieornatus]
MIGVIKRSKLRPQIMYHSQDRDGLSIERKHNCNQPETDLPRFSKTIRAIRINLLHLSTHMFVHSALHFQPHAKYCILSRNSRPSLHSECKTRTKTDLRISDVREFRESIQ